MSSNGEPENGFCLILKKEGTIMPLSLVKEGEPIGGSLIVNVRDARVAIGRDMANKILVN